MPRHSIHTNKHAHMFMKHLGNFIKKTYNKNARNGNITRLAGAYGGPLARTTARAITGHGRYNVKRQPGAAYGKGFTHHAARRPYRRPYHKGRGKSNAINLDKGSSFTIEHSEYMGDLITGTGGTTNATSFTPQSYLTNAANPGMFQWLSNMAVNMQEYKLEKLVFEFRTNTSQAISAASSLLSTGQVIMAYNYNSANCSTFNTAAGSGTSQACTFTSYETKAEMEQSDGSVSTLPSNSAFLHVEVKHRHNPLDTFFCQSQSPSVTSLGVPTSPGDLRFAYHGIFQIASNSCPVPSLTAPISLGEIWVHYRVKLLLPQLNGGLSNILTASYRSTTYTNAAPFTGMTASSTNYLPLSFNSTMTQMQFPIQITSGTYLIQYSCLGTAQATSIPTFLANNIVNGTLVRIWTSAAAADALDQLECPQDALANTTNVMVSMIVKINAPGSSLCTITWPSSPTLPIGGSAQLMVTQWNERVTT